RGLLQEGAGDWDLAQALAGCGKDRVGDGGHDRRGPGFAHAARRLDVLNDVDVDRRGLVHAQHLVGVEIGLLDPAVLQRDIAMQRRRDAEDDRALYLRPHAIGIDDGAAVDRTDAAPAANRRVVRQFDSGYPREI